MKDRDKVSGIPSEPPLMLVNNVVIVIGYALKLLKFVVEFPPRPSVARGCLRHTSSLTPTIVYPDVVRESSNRDRSAFQLLRFVVR
jgi:hypothetical protein